MASKASVSQAGARGEVPAEAAAGYSLLLLLPTVFGQLWPGELVVSGLRVCRQLRQDLTEGDQLVHSGSIVLVQKVEAILDDCRLSADFRRLPANRMVMLKWKDGTE
eukprot:320379-Rhodomonas_salina.1